MTCMFPWKKYRYGRPAFKLILTVFSCSLIFHVDYQHCYIYILLLYLNEQAGVSDYFSSEDFPLNNVGVDI